MSEEKKDIKPEINETTKPASAAKEPAQKPEAPKQQEAAKVEVLKPDAAKPEVPAAGAEKKADAPKPEEKKKEKPSNCAVCNKSIKKKRYYYRNGKYFCTQRCFKTTVKKASPEATDKPAAA